MAAEISMPVYVRVGDVEARWGELTVEATDGTVREQDTRRELAAFLRASADQVENPSEDDEEVPGVAADG
jgi:hypothetical protein